MRLRHMKKYFLFLIIWSSLGIPAAWGGELKTPEALVEDFIQAVNAGDKTLLVSLINPKSVENLSPLETRFLEDLLQNNFRRGIPDDRKVEIKELEEGVVPFGEMMVWKVEPTHYFQIDFSTGENSSTSVIRFIGKNDGRWNIFVAFPNKENMKLYEEKIRQAM